MDRRSLLTGLTLASSASAARAQSPAPPRVQDEEILLWPEGPPGVPAIAPTPPNPNAIPIPKLLVFRPAKPNGVGILMFQGGGYVRIGRGPSVPRWFSDRGFTVFDTLYRLPGGGWGAGPDVGLQDGQRAMRVIRSQARRFGLDPAKIGVAGFSSGGHMASTIATRFATEMAPAGTGLTEVSARPDFALLACPVVTMTSLYAHGGSRKELFGEARDPAALDLRSGEKQVTAQTPPCIFVHAADDNTVPMQNSLMMFTALKAARVPAELHIFETGGHNMGQGFQPDTPLSAYPDLWVQWLARHNFPAKDHA